MSREKIEIDQDMVKRLHSEGMANHAIMKKYKIPGSAIIDILNGRDRPFFMKKSRTDVLKDPCECCGCREKTRHFLCEFCYKGNRGVVGDGDGDGNKAYSSAKQARS